MKLQLQDISLQWHYNRNDIPEKMGDQYAKQQNAILVLSSASTKV